MRLIIAAAAFLVTIGTMSLMQSEDSTPEPLSQAAIIATPAQAIPSTPHPSPKVAAIKRIVPTATPVPTVIPQQQIIPSHTPEPPPSHTATPTTQLKTPIPHSPSNLPSTTQFIPQKTPTPTPSPLQQTHQNHTFYTSSHWKSKYYYCDTDKDWKALSASYLKSFPTTDALLQAFPGRILHESCK